jgi:NADH:ubiquinone oxidoreductase subunit 6 (subunit J)
MDTASLIFYLLATLLVIASLMVVFLRNIVHCAMALVSALLLIAVFFVVLQAPMIGVLQVMVYAGAIMVLFLFVIMFLNPAALERHWSRPTTFPPIRSQRVNYLAVRKCSRKACLTTTCCRSNSPPSYCWWRSSVR